MKDFAGRIAVVTGGGTGMGRELVRQLVAEGCNVAMCDVFAHTMAETKHLCEAARLPQGLRITTHIADVSEEAQMERFRDEVAVRHYTDKIHLLFNNAGIGGGSSMIASSRDEWEKTFNVCWGGVYYSTRAFLPMLQKAEHGYIVNTSSINGFWASIGPRVPHTAYSAAKFAVKGFTEALITDLRLNAPHIKCSVVMPGQIGTSIRSNSRKIHSGTESDVMDATEIAQARARIASTGTDVSSMSDEDIQKMVAERERRFREEAPMTAAAAATVILDGVKAERWRILVGEDALRIDDLVRHSPEHAYDVDFFENSQPKSVGGSADEIIADEGKSPVRKTRIAGDNEEPADAGEGGDDLLDHAVGEILLLRVASHIGERQHRDRRLVGKCQLRGFCRSLGVPLHRHPIHPNRARNIFEPLLAYVLTSEIEFARSILLHPPRYADPSGFGQGFESSGYVYAVAENIAVLDYNIPHVDAYSELDAPVRRYSGVALGHMRKRSLRGYAPSLPS